MDEYKEKIGNAGLARGIFNDASSQSSLIGAPQDAVDRMMEQLADENGVTLRENLESATAVKTAPSRAEITEEEEAASNDRLKALRNAA